MDDKEREERLTRVFALLVKRTTNIETPTSEKREIWSKISYNNVEIDLAVQPVLLD